MRRHFPVDVTAVSMVTLDSLEETVETLVRSSTKVFDGSQSFHRFAECSLGRAILICFRELGSLTAGGDAYTV